MLVTFRIPAPEGQRFMPGCLDDQVNTWQQFAVPGLQPVRGLLVDAAVLPGGEHAELTIDILPDSGTARVISRSGGGGPGPFLVRDNGTVGPRFSLTRADVVEVAETLRPKGRPSATRKEEA